MKFAVALRAAVRNVAAPPGARLRIIEEVGADLEDLYAALRASGVPEAEAKRQAARLLLPDAEAAQALSFVHRPLWARWRDRYGSHRHVGERLLLAISASVAAIGSMVVVIMTGLLPNSSPFVFVLVGIGAMTLLQATVKAVRIWVAGESSADRIRDGTGDLLIGAVASPIACGFGILYGLYRVASTAFTAPEREGELVLEWLRTSVVLGVLGFSISILCGLCWMLFVHRAAVIEMRERAMLGPPLRVNGRRAASRKTAE